jgi:WD40 repeat protein
LITLFIL